VEVGAGHSVYHTQVWVVLVEQCVIVFALFGFDNSGRILRRVVAAGR